MPREPLTSHHLNYLVWRYLQESGLNEAALLLQRQWMSDPQTLPFAPFVGTQALVTLVQKGLQYWELEKSLDKKGDVVTVSEDLSFWGPQPQNGSVPGTKQTARIADEQEQVLTTALKAVPEINGQAPTASARRQRKKPTATVTGQESRHAEESSVTETQTGRTEEIAVDEDGDYAMTDNTEGMHSPVCTLATGQSVGVQIAPEKASDLGPETTLLEAPVGIGAITRSSWRPHDSSTLAMSGDDFCGIWKSSSSHWRGTSAVYHPLVDTHRDEQVAVTAMSWNAEGSILAVATFAQLIGSITLYSPAGETINVLPESPSMISALHWAPDGFLLVVAMSDFEGSQMTLCDQSLKADSYTQACSIGSHVYDISWVNKERVFALAGKAIHEFKIEDNTLQPLKIYQSEDREITLSFLTTAIVGRTPVAIAASSQLGKVWIPTHDIVLEETNHGPITSLCISRQLHMDGESENRVAFITSSMDGSIRLWAANLQTKEVKCHWRLSMGQLSPALAASLSPDSYAIAGVSLKQLILWNVERGGLPIATWNFAEQAVNGKIKTSDNAVEQSAETDESQLQRPLVWDSDGKKLALGFDCKLAIVDFQR